MEDDKIQQKNSDLKVLRTYTSDMADVIRDNEVSVIKIAMAEKERQEQEEVVKKAEGTNFTKLIFIVGGIILIGAAIFFSAYLSKKKEGMQQPIKSSIETFVTYDSELNIDTTNTKNIGMLANAIRLKQPNTPQKIEAIFLSKKVNNISSYLTTGNLLSIIQPQIPDTLLRSLTDRFLIGRYYNPGAQEEMDKKATFLVLETTDYNQAYASMLTWEETLFKDLFILFNLTVPKTNNTLFVKPWKDIVISNKDTRVLYGDDGKGILYYAFANKNDLVITSSREALEEVVSRILIKNVQPL